MDKNYEMATVMVNNPNQNNFITVSISPFLTKTVVLSCYRQETFDD